MLSMTLQAGGLRNAQQQMPDYSARHTGNPAQSMARCNVATRSNNGDDVQKVAINHYEARRAVGSSLCSFAALRLRRFCKY